LECTAGYDFITHLLGFASIGDRVAFPSQPSQAVTHSIGTRIAMPMKMLISRSWPDPS
jgi:hypothetical protein